MKKHNVAPELFALFLSNQTVLEILQQLPRTDLIDEAVEILLDQSEILEAKVEGTQICESDLNVFIEDCLEIFDSYQPKNPLQHFDN